LRKFDRWQRLRFLRQRGKAGNEVDNRQYQLDRIFSIFTIPSSANSTTSRKPCNRAVPNRGLMPVANPGTNFSRSSHLILAEWIGIEYFFPSASLATVVELNGRFIAATACGSKLNSH
jgi:hypothetical protein